MVKASISRTDTEEHEGNCASECRSNWSWTLTDNASGQMYGGAPLSIKSGDFLVEQGVEVWNLYGLSVTQYLHRAFAIQLIYLQI